MRYLLGLPQYLAYKVFDVVILSFIKAIETLLACMFFDGTSEPRPHWYFIGATLKFSDKHFRPKKLGVFLGAVQAIFLNQNTEVLVRQ